MGEYVHGFFSSHANGLTQEQVADLLDINHTTFSRRLTSIIVALDAWVLELFVPASIEEVSIKTHEDDWFAVMGEVPYLILDCTEISIERPSAKQAQALTFSTHLLKPTMKVLLAYYPSGQVAFVSDAFCGSFSDNDIVKKSGLLTFLDSVRERFGYDEKRVISLCADKGFSTGYQELIDHRVRIVVPPRRIDHRFFFNPDLSKKENERLARKHALTAEDIRDTETIAALRVYVEHWFSNIKANKKFRDKQNILSSDLFGRMFRVVAFLQNFRKARKPKARKPKDVVATDEEIHEIDEELD